MAEAKRQIDEFREAAHELEADESEERFDAAFKEGGEGPVPAGQACQGRLIARKAQ